MVATLNAQVEGYLQSLGYAVENISDSIILATKTSAIIRVPSERILIWVLPEPIDEYEKPQVEANLLKEFGELSVRHGYAPMIVIHDFGYDFSRRFSRAAKKYNVSFSVPNHFFDVRYQYENVSDHAHSAIAQMDAPKLRVPQPFEVLRDGQFVDGGEDLLIHLMGVYQFKKGPAIRFILGPAGIGKTILFKTLYRDLYKHFISRKRMLTDFPRPIPIVPMHLQKAGMLRTRNVIVSLIELEIVSQVPITTFEWLVANGRSTWLFDGLDELYSEDKDFFFYLAQIYGNKDASAQILVCARESLLATSENFADFIGIYEKEIPIEIYRLKGWNYRSKRKFSRLFFPTGIHASRFMKYINSSSALDTISTLPFYCDRLAQAYLQYVVASRANPTISPPVEFESNYSLLDFAVNSMISREAGEINGNDNDEGKELLRLEDFEDHGLQDWLMEVADSFCASNYRGVPTESLKDYAMYVTRRELSTQERENVITTLIRFPLFTSNYHMESGMIAFQHELIAEYLSGRFRYPRLIKNSIDEAYELSNRVGFSDSLTARYLSKCLSEDDEGLKSILRALARGNILGQAFTILLRIVLDASSDPDLIVAHSISLENRDLTKVEFLTRNLDNVGFRGSTLLNTTFTACSLNGVSFEGARFIGTRFQHLDRLALEGARFGGLDHFDHAYVERKRYNDRIAFAEWVRKVTGRGLHIFEPCSAAIAVRQVFTKYVHNDGTPKREVMPASVLIRLTPQLGGRRPKDVIEKFVEHGFLRSIDNNDHLRRVPGDVHLEMVEYVTDWKISPRLGKLLDDTCPIEGCLHIPQN